MLYCYGARTTRRSPWETSSGKTLAAYLGNAGFVLVAPRVPLFQTMSFSTSTQLEKIEGLADSLLRDGTVVKTVADAGHCSLKIKNGPALQLMGISNSPFDKIYAAKESLSAFKVRFVGFVVAGAVFPETTAKAERVEFGKVVQAAVDACQVVAAATIDEQLANVVEFEKMANDKENKDKNSVFWLDAMKACKCPKPDEFKAFGGKRAPEGWAKAARRYAATKKAELETKQSSGDDEAAKAAHRAAALSVFKDVHSAVEKYEKAQLEKAVKAGGNALRDRLIARAEARSESMSALQSENMKIKNSTDGVQAKGVAKSVAARIKAARKNKWTARWSTARRNNDPFSRRVRVLTNRMRSTGPLIRDFKDREERELFDRE